MSNRVVLVTGAASGIGKACVDAFLRRGAAFVGLDRNAAIEAMWTRPDFTGIACDITDAQAVDTARGTAVKRYGGMDMLVNNACFTRAEMMTKMTEQQWDDVVDIHLKGAFLCTQVAVPHMIAKNRGKIINITSVAGVVGTVGQMNYSAAKGGVISMTKSMARELARNNICANVICLGIVTTDMTEKITTDQKLKEVYMNRILLKRFAGPEDVTPAFVFLASDEANYITGQLLCVDGGYGMI